LFLFLISLLPHFAQSQQIPKSKTAMLTPTEQRNLTFLSLLGAQKDLAAGHFSAIQGSTDDDIDRITSYFDRDVRLPLLGSLSWDPVPPFSFWRITSSRFSAVRL
jgi:hypothetical protein